MTAKPVAPLDADDLRAVLRARHAVFAREADAALHRAASMHVHQARVTARRLRSLIRALEPALDPRLAARLRRDLRHAAAELAAVREADVRRDWLHALPATTRLPPGARLHLEAELERARDRARRRLREAARGVVWRERLQRIAATVADPKLVQPRGAVEPIRREALRRVGRRLRRWDGSADPDDLHRLRILAKRARYACETLLPLLHVDPARYTERLARLQSALGSQRDAVQLLAWLRTLREPLSSVLLGRLGRPIARSAERSARQAQRMHARLPRLDLNQGAKP
jgi:CHAD domain-containing protein